MTIFYSLYENPDLSEEEVALELDPSPVRNDSSKNEIHLLEEKLRIPHVENQIERARLTELLKSSLRKFGATLISGRSGTGKTALAARFARQYQKVSWYSIGSSEADWDIFSKYFEASLTNQGLHPRDDSQEFDPQRKLEKIAYNTERIITEISLTDKKEERLIVLDNTHHLFDSDWFTSFFYSLVGSLGPTTHLLMLCRGTPSLPMWRLRSKQVLGVLDEFVLNFNIDETREFVSSLGIPTTAAGKIQSRSFGRVSKLKQFAEKYSLK